MVVDKSKVWTKVYDHQILEMLEEQKKQNSVQHQDFPKWSPTLSNWLLLNKKVLKSLQHPDFPSGHPP